jgi:hypothetical protein
LLRILATPDNNMHGISFALQVHSASSNGNEQASNRLEESASIGFNLSAFDCGNSVQNSLFPIGSQHEQLDSRKVVVIL